MKVDSSHLNEVWHNESTNTLTVEFHNGKRWSYTPVTSTGFQDLINAESVGSYFAKNIKNNPDIEGKEDIYE